MTRRYDRSDSSSSDDSDGSDDRERRDSSDEDSADGDARDSRTSRRSTRKSSGNVLLLGVVFFLAIVACLSLAWYHFSPTGISASSASAAKTTTASTSASDEVEDDHLPISVPEGSETPASSSLFEPATSQRSSSASKSTSASPQATSSSPPAAAGEGLVGYVDEKCGPSGAVAASTKDAGPNGGEDWLNCGLSKDKPDAPWTPPSIKLDQVKTITLEEALAMDKSAYKACTTYVPLFEKHAEAYEVPPILLAAFAMQESSCNADTMGDAGGAYGLMQITEDKCGGAPGGNCRDPDFNIKTGAAYFAQVLKEHDGSLLLAMGTYNGWYAGLTYNKATAARHTSCCECQNNLDYHHSMLNGWLLGLDGSQMGTIRNIECS